MQFFVLIIRNLVDVGLLGGEQTLTALLIAMLILIAAVISVISLGYFVFNFLRFILPRARTLASPVPKGQMSAELYGQMREGYSLLRATYDGLIYYTVVRDSEPPSEVPCYVSEKSGQMRTIALAKSRAMGSLICAFLPWLLLFGMSGLMVLLGNIGERRRMMLPIWLIFLGFVFLGLALWFVYKNRSQRGMVVLQGTVSACEEQDGHCDSATGSEPVYSTKYHYIFEFMGQVREGSDTLPNLPPHKGDGAAYPAGRPQFSVGRRIDVCYDTREDTSHIMVNSRLVKSYYWLVPLLFGVALIVVGALWVFA